MKSKNTIPIKTVSIKQIYKNPWLKVEEHKVIMSDDSAGIYSILDYGDGVVILPVDSKGNIYLIKEYKYAIKKFIYQLPSGTVDQGESPLEAAKRELLEETGMEANIWQENGFIYPLPTAITTTDYLFLASGVSKVKNPEAGISLYRFSDTEVEEMINGSQITHSGSVVCLLQYFLSKYSK